MVKPTTVQLILSLDVTFGWSLRQLDVKNVFLHGTLNEEVYMDQPPNYIDPHYPTHVCHLNKALNGLKQALQAWFHCFSTFLIKFYFRCSHDNSSLFIYQQQLDTIYLLLHVDCDH